MSHDSQTSSGIAPDILHRLDPRAAVHPDYYIVGSGREEVTPTCLVSDWVNFAQDDDQNAVQALRIRRRDLEDFIKVQDQDNGPHAPERVMPLGYWVINNSPDMGGPPPTDTSVTVILQYKTFRICICCMVEKDFVIGREDVEQIVSSCLKASSGEELPPCMGSMLYEDQVVHWLVVPAVILRLLSSVESVERARTRGNLPNFLDDHELVYNLDWQGVRELTRLRGDHEGHVVSSLKAKLTPELRETQKDSIQMGLHTKLYSGSSSPEYYGNFVWDITDSEDGHTLTLDNGQTMLSPQPYKPSGCDRDAEQQNIGTNPVNDPLQHGWAEGNPQALSMPLDYGVQATGNRPTLPSSHSNGLVSSDLYAAQRDEATNGVAYPRNAGQETTVHGGHEQFSAEAGPCEHWDHPQGQQNYDSNHHSG